MRAHPCFIAVAALLLCFPATCGAQPPAPGGASPSPSLAAAPAGWTLVFSDEFDAPGALDQAKWGYETGSQTWPFDTPQYLLVNLAIGGAWGGQKGIDDTRFPHRYVVDYVRIYQQR